MCAASPVVVLAQPDQLTAGPEFGAELAGALGQQAIGGGPQDAEDVRMCGVQPVRPWLDDAGEGTPERVLVAEREEPLQQTALVHHLDAARVQTERADIPGRLRLLLQHDRSHPSQPQLAGQHQPGRSTAGNDHIDHHHPIPVEAQGFSMWLRSAAASGGTTARGIACPIPSIVTRVERGRVSARNRELDSGLVGSSGVTMTSVGTVT